MPSYVNKLPFRILGLWELAWMCKVCRKRAGVKIDMTWLIHWMSVFDSITIISDMEF